MPCAIERVKAFGMHPDIGFDEVEEGTWRGIIL